MVKRLISGFRREQSGVVLVEALISLPIVVLMITAMVELGLAMFQWNQTVRSIQLGARLAAVSSPVTGDRGSTYQTPLIAGYGTDQGGPIPGTVVSVACGADTGTNCDATLIQRLVRGGDNTCGGTLPGTSAGMCDIAPWVRPENVRVTYTRAGLGYVGRPYGVVTTVTVELRNLQFDFILLDAVLNLFLTNPKGGIAIPSHPVTMTSEDLSSCNTLC